MKKGLKKCLAATLVMVLGVSVFAGCGSKTPSESTSGDVATTAPTKAATVAPTEVVPEEPVIDLGGMEITLGDWWTAAEQKAPTNAYEEATLEYREMIQKKYNFTMKQVAITDWGGMQELFTTSVMAEDPAADIFLLGPAWTVQPLANGLLYDLSTLDELDFTEEKWINNVKEIMTFGDSVYGMNAGKSEPKLGVFFNKRLFAEAGLDPNLPYDLQERGEWTWEEFEVLCEKLLIDNNNDGVIDTYPMVNFSVDLYKAAITSNNAKYINKDADGNYYNATTEPNFLEALQWATGLIEKGYEMPTPADANWDWFKSAFFDAKAAMRFAEEYVSGDLATMQDDFGFVMLPQGPKSTGYSVYFSDNVAVIPSCFDEETASKIAFAYDLWTQPTPGYEDDDYWKERYYGKFRDERAVDETLSMMFDRATENNDFQSLVYGTSQGDFCYGLYALNATPAEKIEEVQGMWAALIEDANK